MKRKPTDAGFCPECRDCPRLARYLDQIKRDHPDYYAMPVPAFGDADAKLLIVGLAPGMHGANRTGRPFTGDYAGKLLYQTLHRFGFANQPYSTDSHDSLQLIACRVTNAVKCLPPNNKPNNDEILICNKYLTNEIKVMGEGSAVLALGTIAHRAVLKAMGLKIKDFLFAHDTVHALPNGLTLYDSYHCSRYNTQTRRLTQQMFEAVFARISHQLLMQKET
ncbi:MAG TPA: uracil-DNA glycosylase [Burkholderiales bacterium]|nr:uracil-DNA glycosylase [Burkholderiales bacterium]